MIKKNSGQGLWVLCLISCLIPPLAIILIPIVLIGLFSNKENSKDDGYYRSRHYYYKKTYGL